MRCDVPAGIFVAMETKKLDRSASPPNEMFSPPEKSVLADCMHCGKRFRTSRMFYGWKERMSHHEGEPLWWCPTPDCDGAGYGFDIHPISRKHQDKEPA